LPGPRIPSSPILTPKLKRVIGGTDGRLVGENDVGSTLGHTLGKNDGEQEGNDVGITVGDPEGRSEGLFVG
jgi:hypothetical protein